MADDARQLAPHVAERIERAQDMLGRLGQRSSYEPNYATEKLADAARCALEACALLGMDGTQILQLAGDAFERGAGMAERMGTAAS